MHYFTHNETLARIEKRISCEFIFFVIAAQMPREKGFALDLKWTCGRVHPTGHASKYTVQSTTAVIFEFLERAYFAFSHLKPESESFLAKDSTFSPHLSSFLKLAITLSSDSLM